MRSETSVGTRVNGSLDAESLAFLGHVREQRDAARRRLRGRRDVEREKLRGRYERKHTVRGVFMLAKPTTTTNTYKSRPRTPRRPARSPRRHAVRTTADPPPGAPEDDEAGARWQRLPTEACRGESDRMRP
jgi:hypothetical protein